MPANDNSNNNSTDETTGQSTASSASGPMRVHALAKELGVTSKALIERLAELGSVAKGPQSNVPAEAVDAVRTSYGIAAPQPDVAAGDQPDATEPVIVELDEGASPVPGEAQPVVQFAPAVLFQAPSVDLAGPAEQTQSPDAPKRPARRRGGRRAAGPAESVTVTAGDVADAASGAEDGLAGSAGVDSLEPVYSNTHTDGTDTDATDEADVEGAGAENGDVPSGPRKRRRRGRRGRGNRRDLADETGEAAGDDSDDADQDTTDPEAGLIGITPEAVADPSDTEALDADEDDVESDADEDDDAATEDGAEGSGSTRRRRRRRRGGSGASGGDRAEPVSSRRSTQSDDDEVRGVKGSTRLEAKRQRRRDNRDSGRRRAPILSEAEFLARREAVDRVMAVRQRGDRTQIAVLEDDILVEHYVTRASATSYVGNVYLGRVQNVLPSMEAAFVDIGKGRNGVLYAGEVNWDAAGLEGKARAIENAMKPGDAILVQVTKDPIGHKGARLTSQISLPGRFLVFVPGGGMTGISRKLPDTERTRLKAILKKIVPDEAGVIIRTAAEGASEEELTSDVERLKAEWETISKQAEKASSAPTLVHGEPDLAIRVVRDVFNEDFGKLIVSGDEAWDTISKYVSNVAPDLAPRVVRHTAESDLFHDLRVDEQLAKALDRKVWLPSGGSLVIDRTEAMTVIDVNTGKFTGTGGNLEQTVTRNNLEAAEEIVRQLRLRDIGGIVVIDFIDMVLESNRDLVLRRLTECLGRDRTKHQVAEVTSLGLVQMTRKRVGEGLLEAFSEPCEHCHGRGIIVHSEPLDRRTANGNGNGATAGGSGGESGGGSGGRRSKRGRGRRSDESEPVDDIAPIGEDQRRAAASAIAAIAAKTLHHDDETEGSHAEPPVSVDDSTADEVIVDVSTDDANDADQFDTDQTDADEFDADVIVDDVVIEDVNADDAGLGGDVPAPDGGGAPVAEVIEVVVPAGPGRPRRRRAASRPAGPPVLSE